MSYINSHDTILLRVGKNSPLDKVLRPMFVDGQMLTDAELDEKFGRTSGLLLLNLTSKWFDNVTIETIKEEGKHYRLAHYTDVTPKKIIPVSERLEAVKAATKVNVIADNGQAPAGQPAELGEEPVVWGEVPPQLHPHPNFVEPKYYRTMKHMVRSGRHIRLAGPPSVGKDTAIKQLAWESGKPLVSLNGSSLRERHMTGIRAQDASGRSYFLPSQFATAVVMGWWCNLTEINAAESDVLLWLNSVTEEPFVITLNGKAYPVHKEFRLFCSYNPGALGTRPLPASLLDRFFPIKLDFHNESSLRRILEANGMPTADLIKADDYGNQRDWTTCLVKFAIKLWETHENGKMKYQITVRRCMDVSELMKAFREDGIDGFKAACRAAIVDAIDNPLDAKEAERVLKEITC